MAAEQFADSSAAAEESQQESQRSWLHRLLASWERNPKRGWVWSGIFVAVVVGLAFALGLGSIGLVDETEPLFAEAARQMLVRDDWVTPFFNEATRFDKPPLIYWLMAIAYKIFGVNDWSVRVPSLLSATVLTGLVWFVLQRHGVPAFRRQAVDNDSGVAQTGSPRYSRWLTSGLGAALTAFNLETIAWGRIGVSDMLLSGCFGAALLTFFMAYAAGDPPQPPFSKRGVGEESSRVSPDPLASASGPPPFPRGELEGGSQAHSHWLLGFNLQDRWYLVSYLFIALAILAKGPVGIVLPGVITIGFTLYTGQLWNTIVEMKPWRGIPLIGLITVPWYILVIQANGEAYTKSFFGYHNFDRFTKTVNNHGAPWYFYFLIVLIGFAPWSLFIPAAITRLKLWRWKRWVNQPRSAQLGVFAAAWFIGVFVFFTVAATKLPSYVLPLMPAAAILVALLFSDEMTRPLATGAVPQRRGLGISGWFNFGFLLVMGGAIAASPLWLKLINDPAMPDFPQALGDSGLLIFGAIFCLQAAAAVFILMRRHQQRWLWAPNLIGFVALFLFTLLPIIQLMDIHRQAPLRQIAATSAQVRQADEDFIMVGFEKPTVVFYSDQAMLFFRRSRSALRYIETYSLPKPTPETVLILTYPDELDDLGLEPSIVSILDQAGAYVLVRVNKEIFRQLFIEQPTSPESEVKILTPEYARPSLGLQ